MYIKKNLKSRNRKVFPSTRKNVHINDHITHFWKTDMILANVSIDVKPYFFP